MVSPSHGGAGDTGASSRGLALVLASAAFALPLLLSRSTSPSPNRPRIFFWYRTLKQPGFKPPDVAIPLAWTAIETALAVAGYVDPGVARECTLFTRDAPARSTMSTRSQDNRWRSPCKAG